MPPDPRLVSIRAAERSSRELAVLFGQLGTIEHPRGAILRAYRNASGALESVLRGSPGGQMAQFRALEVFATLRNDVEAAARETMTAAAGIGIAQAQTEARARGLGAITAQPVVAQTQIDPWLAIVAEQQAAALGILYTGADPALILGDEMRMGILQPAPVTREGSRWLTLAALAAWALAIRGPAAEAGLEQKQAVAALDERTTQTCLRVHAQVKPFDQPYRLTGTPRFADEIQFPPFHWYCRTVSVLVAEGEESDQLSQAMREASAAELAARAEDERRIDEIQTQLASLGVVPNARVLNSDTDEIRALRRELRAARERPEIHPASALSRRG